MRPLLWLKYLPHEARKELDRFRTQLARPDAILSLSLLGLLAGSLAALTIIALRLMVADLQVWLWPMDRPEDFEATSMWWRLVIPTGGGLLIGGLYAITKESSHTVGILHVLERLARHQGRLTWSNTVVQFIGGAISMIAGHSVGREGPSAHLGAASSNLPAQALHFPNNSLRILAACGAAAGIAASFNTPLAGAVFAMEVLLMEYTLAGFMPVIMATVSATTLTRIVFGSHLAYDVPPMSLDSLHELPFILVGGIMLGLLAGSFNRLLHWVSAHSKKLPRWLRPAIAGLLVGVCGMAVPEVMGMGNDTVSILLNNQVELSFLFLLVTVKIIATTGGIGMGLPAGMIGPIMFVGAAAGSLWNALGTLIGMTVAVSSGFYALLGMAAMMAGMMIAPMAGLVAILELSGEPNIILPGMLVVVTATISSGYLTRRESVFLSLLRARGYVYRTDPLAQSLRRVGVVSAVDKRVVSLPREAASGDIDRALADKPQWIRITKLEGPDVVLKAADLVHAREQSPDTTTYDLLEIPGERKQADTIINYATLQEAHEQMLRDGRGILLVINPNVPGIPRLVGVLTREAIEDSYQHGHG